MDERSRLIRLCVRGMEKKKLTNEAYKERLRYELKQLDLSLLHEYILKCYDSRAMYPNDHNLLVPYLLGICPDFNIEQEGAHVHGEWPDIDTDFLPDVRDALKREWAPEVFGHNNVCEISTYGTLGIKQAILDMTMVYGIPKEEIQAITVDIEDKDEDGHLLEWDKALELYPAFRSYCERFPHVAEAAKEIIGRNRQNGIHAGGLIISSTRLDDFVPLEVRSVSKENPKGVVVAAWSEGQRTQELQAVGLIKFDYLVVDGLQQYGIPATIAKQKYAEKQAIAQNAEFTKLIREHNGIKNIYSLPGMNRDWSDDSYLNDPKALQIANAGDTRCIFQLGSDGIRALLKQGGVTSFNDIAAYNALFRPGPLGMKMDQAYCRRKKGLEKYELHPTLEPILGYTYGVMAYQEQVMQILNKVGKVPLMHCEKIRKAISKKKLDVIAKYQQQFIVNGQITIGASPEYLLDMFKQIEAFSGYGFNKAHSYAYSMISARQLNMMAYFPLEFYASVLTCEKKTEKVKEEIIDARRHGIEVKPLNINKSDAGFGIIDDKIYFGFGKIKGIGDEVAKKIAAGQPYSSFVDFLDRFGTDLKVVSRLIALNAFEDPYDRLTLFKFYDMYKKKSKKQTDQIKTNAAAVERYKIELIRLIDEYAEQLPDEHLEAMAQFNDEAYRLWSEYASKIEVDQHYTYKGDHRTRKVTVEKLLNTVRHKLEKSMRNFHERQEINERETLTLDGFDAKRWKIEKNEKEITDLMTDEKEAERQFYGFVWKHDLEESPDYTGKTIEAMLTAGGKVGCIEVQILKVEHRTSKNNTTYYSIMVEDACGQTARITMWSDDFARFAPDLRVGNLVKMRVFPPSQNFKGLTFESPSKRERWKLPKDKALDCRLYVMKRGTPQAPAQLDLTEFSLEEEE